MPPGSRPAVRQVKWQGRVSPSRQSTVEGGSWSADRNPAVERRARERSGTTRDSRGPSAVIRRMFRFASLSRRRRGPALFEHLLSATELEPFKDIALGVQEVHRPLAAGPVSTRLGPLLGDWEPTLSSLDPSTRAAYAAPATPDERLYLRLHLAVWQDAPGFVETSGL